MPNNQPKTFSNPRGAGRPRTNRMTIYLSGIDDRTFCHLIELREEGRLNKSVIEWADASAKIVTIKTTKTKG